MASRIVSTTSLATADLVLEAEESPYLTQDAAAYKAVLKVVVLDYINEPRFRVVQREGSPLQAAAPRAETQKKRKSWFMLNEESAGVLPRDIVGKLKTKLESIAVGRSSVSNPLLKRSALKLYNDMMDPGQSAMLQSIENPEDLIMLFVRAANFETHKLGVENAKDEIMNQTIGFVDILATLVSSEAALKRLRDYKETLTPRQSSTPLALTPVTSSNLSPVTSGHKPSFKLSEMSDAVLVGSLFGYSELTIQQDVVALIGEVSNSIVFRDLKRLHDDLVQDTGEFLPKDFTTIEDYDQWKNEELVGLNALLEKFASTAKVPPKTPRFIPPGKKQVLTSLLLRVLQREPSNQISSLVQQCCRYWRISPSSIATSIYTAANLGILKGELHTELYFEMRQLIERYCDTDSSKWPKSDRNEWSESVIITLSQVMVAVKELLPEIFNQTKPKFTPFLQVYHEFLEADPLLPIEIVEKWMKKQKRAVCKSAESRYIKLVECLPRDGLEMFHVYELSEMIVHDIKLIQKRYSKPLFDFIVMSFECAIVLIEAFSSDMKTMLYKVESTDLHVPVHDALETYKEFAQLRSIYAQIKPETPYPVKLEKLFYKYAAELCEETCVQIVETVQSALLTETWKPCQPGVLYTSSAVDVFKMINESVSLFKNLNWDNRYQNSKIMTHLLKAISDATCIYTSRMIELITSEIDSMDASGAASKANNRTSRMWTFEEMKDALSSKKRAIPEPFVFSDKICLALNNLQQVQLHLNKLEELLDPDTLSKIVTQVEERKGLIKEPTHHLFTVRIMRAENLEAFDGSCNPRVTLVDSKKQIYKTKIVDMDLNPVWDEDVDIMVFTENEPTKVVRATVWHTEKKQYEICGRCSLVLDPGRFSEIATELVLDLDIQGRLYLQVSVESERFDAIFSMGKAYRATERTMERTIRQIVDKFSDFIQYAFSRETLKGATTPDTIYDAIEPLFDYLNSNLEILASQLNNELLLKIMIQAWNVVLKCADNLLLPTLSSAKLQADNNIWNTVLNKNYKPLTYGEVDIVFEWLQLLCVDFFHNEGEGPPLEDLKNAHYQQILLIQNYYHCSVAELKEMLGSEGGNTKLNSYMKYLRKRTKTLRRKHTIRNNGLRRIRQKIAQEEKNIDPDEVSVSTQDIILRVLLAKGEKDFVTRELDAREQMAKKVTTEKLIKYVAS